MKEQQQSDRERAQMMLDRDYILREQEELQAQVVTFQNNSARTEDDTEDRGSLNLHVLDELIKKRIVEAKLPQHLIPTTYLHDSSLSKDIQECELPRKFLTPTFDSYTGASDPIQHIWHFQDKMMFSPVMIR